MGAEVGVHLAGGGVHDDQAIPLGEYQQAVPAQDGGDIAEM